MFSYDSNVRTQISKSIDLAEQYLWYNLAGVCLNCFVDTNILFMRHSASLKKVSIVSSLVTLIAHCMLGRLLIVKYSMGVSGVPLVNVLSAVTNLIIQKVL